MNTDRLLKAISKSATALFRGRDMGRACAGLLRGLGKAAGVSRVYFFENHRGPRGEMLTTRRHEWVAPGVSARIDKPGTASLPLQRIGYLRDRMCRGPFHGLVRAMPPSIRGIMDAQQILSLALVPVYVESEWHGFLGFDDCAEPRLWTETEIKTLQIAAGILGGAIERRRSEERLRSILECGIDSLDTGIFILDRKFRVVWVNRTMEKFFGISRARVIGGDQRQFVRGPLRALIGGHAAFARRVMDGYRGAGGGRPLRCEVTAARGRPRRVLQYRCTPISRGALAGGRIEHFKDITDVERANAALKISEAKYRDLVERMNEGVCHSDEHQVIRYANRCFCKTFGYPQDEIIGRPEEGFLDGEGVRVYRREQRRRRRGESTRYELRVRARSGEMVPVLVSAVPVMDEDGRYRGSYAVFTDMSERKRIEVLKDGILRDASHELKAPTAKIKMGLDLVKKRRPAPLDDDERLGLAMIESAVARIQKNVNSLIDLFAFDLGSVTLCRERFDLDAVLAPLADEFAPEAREKGISLAFLPSPPGLRVSGDRDRLNDLFRNLVENAIKFTSAGAVRVSARHAEGEVVVSVADEGRGIEPSYLEKMFERRFQRYPSEPGTGIGLTLCRKIAELHGGRIWAESGGRGKGLTVRVALPARGAVRNAAPGAR
ncbi:MAG: PAS domain S-box protein [Chlamydiota bacterium]